MTILFKKDKNKRHVQHSFFIKWVTLFGDGMCTKSVGCLGLPQPPCSPTEMTVGWQSSLCEMREICFPTFLFSNAGENFLRIPSVGWWKPLPLWFYSEIMKLTSVFLSGTKSCFHVPSVEWWSIVYISVPLWNGEVLPCSLCGLMEYYIRVPLWNGELLSCSFCRMIEMPPCSFFRTESYLCVPSVEWWRDASVFLPRLVDYMKALWCSGNSLVRGWNMKGVSELVMLR